jgi:hypothetical protein
MIPARANRFQLAVVFLLLAVLHFYVRPRLGWSRASPDFLFVGLLLYAMRSPPGAAALAGFAIGLAADSLTPARFRCRHARHTVVGYLASWARSCSSPTTCWSTRRSSRAALAAGPHRARGQRVATGRRDWSSPCSPLQAITSALFALLVLLAFVSGSRSGWTHEASRMSGFDSYRVRERADVARWILVAAFLALSGAFFRTQIMQHDKFQLKAETNRLRPIALTPPRGAILDRRGRIIAENVPGYSVKLLAPSKDSLLAVLARLARYVPLAFQVPVVRRHMAATSRSSSSAMRASRRSPGWRSIAPYCRGS